MSEKLMRVETNAVTGETVYIELTEQETAEHLENARLNLEQQTAQEAEAERKRQEAEAMPQTVSDMRAEIEALKRLVEQLAKK